MFGVLSNLEFLDIITIYGTYLQHKQEKRDTRDISNRELLEYIFSISNVLDKKLDLLINRKGDELKVHKELIKHANDEQLREFADDALSMIKETNHDLYETLEMHLYKEMYGCHFNEWLLEKAIKNMVNEDGTTGEHWNLEQTNSVAKQYGINFNKFNEYDWNYVMNMIYSDYYGAIPNETSNYIKIAKAFLNDKDAKEGKAFHYYISMKK